MANPAGKMPDGVPTGTFRAPVMMEFRRSVVASDAGLLAYRELDDALGLNHARPGLMGAG